MDINKQIAIAERRGEFDLAETLKRFDFAPVPIKKINPVRYQALISRVRAANR